MKIGLINNQYSKSAIKADIELPDEVIYATETMSKRWKDNPHANIQSVPWMTSEDQGGHGPENPGLIYSPSFRVNFPKPDIAAEMGIQVRVSFGMNRPYAEKDNWRTFDMRDFDRMHIGIAADRRFYTDDHFEIKDSRDSEGALSPCEERLSLSLRWVKDGDEFKFDDWSLPDRGYHNKRTSHAYWRAPSGGISLPNRGISVEDYVSQREKKEKFLEPLVQPTPQKYLNVVPGIPKGIFGHGPILGFLSRFGDVFEADGERVAKMTPRQGMEYLLENVLPAVETFVKS